MAAHLLYGDSVGRGDVPAAVHTQKYQFGIEMGPSLFGGVGSIPRLRLLAAPVFLLLFTLGHG